jgi:predicted dienelactone hydrolase
MLKYCLLAAIVAISGHALAASADASPALVGSRPMSVMAPERGKKIHVTLWYPAATGGKPEPIGATKVFKGVTASADAPMAAGVFPLVLLAHGGLRAAPGLGNWIAADLARKGYVVALVHAPLPNELSARAAVRELWLRPGDLSAALTSVMHTPKLARHLQHGAIGVVGFLRGGTSALALAGARLDAQRYRHSCDKPRTSADCHWFAHNKVDLRTADIDRAFRSFMDKRIKTAVVIDPELSGYLTPKSLSSIGIPVELIRLDSGAVPGFDAAALLNSVPGIHYDIVKHATAFSSFSLCTARASKILRAAPGSEPICGEGNKARSRMHARIAGLIEASLQRTLPLPHRDR